MFVGIQFTALLFGVVLLFQDLGKVSALDGATGSSAEGLRRLRLWAGIMFALTAVVVLACETWVARRRWAEYSGSGFARVQPLLVLPEVGLIFALILVFLIYGWMDAALTQGTPVTSAVADEMVERLAAFSLSSLALPVGVYFAAPVDVRPTRGFLRALLREEIGILVMLAAFAWAFLGIQALPA